MPTTSSERMLPAERDGQPTDLLARFERSDDDGALQGVWSVAVIDLESPEGADSEPVWRSYFGFAENMIDSALGAGLLSYATGRGHYQVAREHLLALRHQAVSLGILESLLIVGEIGPRSRESNLAR